MIKINAASDKELQIKNVQKCLENKQDTNEKMININLHLQQRKYEITRKAKEHNNLKEEIKTMTKEQIQQKQKEKTFRTLKIQKKLKENYHRKTKCNIKISKPCTGNKTTQQQQKFKQH